MHLPRVESKTVEFKTAGNQDTIVSLCPPSSTTSQSPSDAADGSARRGIGEVLEFPVHGDHTGSLVALEKGADFPFEIKRVYYIWGTARDVVRGHHAHKDLEQVVVCTSGSCDFILDDGARRETYHLDSPTKGLHIKNNVWREFTNFSPDCVVMVLASAHYNEADYIRDYGDFLRSIGR